MTVWKVQMTLCSGSGRRVHTGGFTKGIKPGPNVEILVHGGVRPAWTLKAYLWWRYTCKGKDFNTDKGKGLVTITAYLSVKENKHKARFWSKKLEPSVSASLLIPCVYNCKIIFHLIYQAHGTLLLYQIDSWALFFEIRRGEQLLCCKLIPLGNNLTHMTCFHKLCYMSPKVWPIEMLPNTILGFVYTEVSAHWQHKSYLQALWPVFGLIPICA